jgi:myo-inositol 2-dehydrogenase/D-chiro-inositol 1-dehydrogenase
MREVRVGVIGAGAMGAAHIATLDAQVDGARVVAVHDPARAGGGSRPTGEELIADRGVDAVLIASPPQTHEALLRACLDHGKPVLCEKPLAESAEACARIVAAERASGARLIQVGFMRRFDPAYLHLRGQLEAGAIGAPLVVHCAHRNATVPEHFDAALALTDSVVHEVDVLRWLLGDEIAAVTVHNGRPAAAAPAGVADPQLVLFETASGVLADVESFLRAGYGYDIRCEVVGELGTLALPQRVDPGFEQRFADAYRAELEAWIASVRSGDPAGPGAQDGLAAARVTAAALRSAATGGRVPVA